MIERIRIKGFRILRDFDWTPNEGVNIIVGDNASGKSTILDAIELGMRCRWDGVKASEALDPHWFNQDDVDGFYEAISTGVLTPEPPAILIELYFRKDQGEIAHLQGINNSLELNVPGISLSISLNLDLQSEFFSTVRKDKQQSHLLPIEYYSIVWQSFAGATLVRTPDSVACFRIDASSSRSANVIDYYARSTVDSHISDEERRQVSLKYRSLKQSIDENVLQIALKDDDNEIPADISFKMDQSSRSDWRNSISIHKGKLPLALAGRGAQIEAKTSLALKKAESKKVLLMEEPENHLSHTSLTRLMGEIEARLAGRQLFVTTHSAFVLNRLGLNKLALLTRGNTPKSIERLSDDTVSYFQKQSGVDTLRIVLGNRIVLVEGPSDEMIFNWAYEKRYLCSPQDAGVDVIAYGVRGKRALELAHALDKKPVAVLRDNDGRPPQKWQNDARAYLNNGRKMFVGNDVNYRTLEPQMVAANADKLSILAKLIRFPDSAVNEEELINFMLDNKTEWAWLLVSSESDERNNLAVPTYIVQAVEFVGQYQNE